MAEIWEWGGRGIPGPMELYLGIIKYINKFLKEMNKSDDLGYL